MKRALAAVAAFAVASVALCQLSKYKDWAKSPEAYFLTASEKQDWAKVQSDADAEKFIADYWARRGGERFKDGVTRRIAAADQQFKLRRQKGSESVRGRIFITLGNPSKVSEAHEGPQAGQDGSGQSSSSTGGVGNFDTGGSGPMAVTQTWIYLKDKFDASWDVGELQARIGVDPQRGTDELMNAPQVNKAIEKVVEHTIVSPAGQPAAAASAAGAAAVKPAAPAAASGPATAPAAAPPAPPVASLPAAPRAVLEPLLKATPAKSGGFFGGPFRTVTGEPFYALSLSVPADKVPAGAAVKIGGLVTKEDGSEAASFWDDAAFIDAKTGTKIDKSADHSVSLPPGTYHGAFGLFGADGTALVTAADSISIDAKPGEWLVSPMILAANLTPLTKRPNPTDAFVFGMEKPIRVDPKVNGLFTREDGLWYFYTVSNPALPAEAPAPAADAAAPAATPAPGAAAPAAAAPAPRVMTRLGVLRDGKPAFAPSTLKAELQPLGQGYYASGSEIPLASFEPGYYTFNLKVWDLNAPRDSAPFKGVERSSDFVVLMPDGSMPPKATPVPVKPTPAARPKKKP